jgi:prevent-host-death family protein
MDISVSDFKQRCLEIIRQVEQGGQPVTILRRGKPVARLQAPVAQELSRGTKPWAQLRERGGRLLAKPGESVIRDEDFEALG